MANPNNVSIVTGRLARDLAVFTNSDGSHTVAGTLMVDANYRGRDGQAKTQAVGFSSLVGTRVNGLGGWGNVGKGDLISIVGSLDTAVYEKEGKTVYELRLEVEGFPQFLEPKSVTDARKAEHAKSAPAAAPAAAPAEAPAQAEDKDAEIARLKAQLAGQQGGQSYTSEPQF